MKVCMVSYSFYESDTRILQYARALRERGDSVDVVALRGSGDEAYGIVDGVRVHRIQSRALNERRRLDYLTRILLFMMRAAVLMTRMQFSRRYDVIHVHSVPDFLVFAAIVPKVLGAKLILDIHDILPEFYASKFNLSPQSWMFRALLLCERLSTAFANHVIVANELWQERLLARAVPSGKCTVIRNYPDEDLFFRRPTAVSGDEKFLILYPGSLNRHQGLDIAIRAFGRIADIIPNAEFRIYGDGPEKPMLIALRDSLGLQSRLRIADSLPLHKIVKIMANADLAVVPKRVSSGFGNEAASTKIMEFMALGVPVIVSRTRIDSFYHDDSMVQFVEPEDEGALAEAMLRLYRDPGLRRNLAENALRYVQQYRWEMKKAEYLSIVDSFAPHSLKAVEHACHA